MHSDSYTIFIYVFIHLFTLMFVYKLLHLSVHVLHYLPTLVSTLFCPFIPFYLLHENVRLSYYKDKFLYIHFNLTGKINFFVSLCPAICSPVATNFTGGRGDGRGERERQAKGENPQSARGAGGRGRHSQGAGEVPAHAGGGVTLSRAGTRRAAGCPQHRRGETPTVRNVLLYLQRQGRGER